MKIDRAMCIGSWMHGKFLETRWNDYIPISRYDHRNYWDLTLEEKLEIGEPIDRYYLISKRDSNTGQKEYFYLWNNDKKIFDHYFNKYVEYELF